MRATRTVRGGGFSPERASSVLSRHLLRCGLILLGTVAAGGCNGDGTPTNDSGGTRPPDSSSPAQEPSYLLGLSSPPLSIAAGMYTPSVTVGLVRTNFSGSVALSVENLPTGVSASFYPASPLTGNSTNLYLHVSGEAAIGTVGHLLVRGVASGLTDRTATLALTVTAAPFALTLASSTLSVIQGTATPTTTVNVARNDYAGPVSLWADIGDFHGTMPPGVTAAFAPNPTTGTNSVLTLTVGAKAAPGVYELWIYGEGMRGVYFEGLMLKLTIAAAPSP